MLVTFFPVTFPVSKAIAYLPLVLCTLHHLQVHVQYNFGQITASFLAGRRQHLVVSDVLLFWHSWFKYRFIKLDLVNVRKVYFTFVYLVA